MMTHNTISLGLHKIHVPDSLKIQDVNQTRVPAGFEIRAISYFPMVKNKRSPTSPSPGFSIPPAVSSSSNPAT